MANVTVSFLVEDDQATPAPIEGVAVRIFQGDGTTFVTEGLTAADGTLDVTLFGDNPGIDYVVRLFKEGVSFLPDANFDITVNDPAVPPNSFTFTDGVVGQIGELVTFVVQDQDSNLVESVRIRVFDENDLFLTELETDSDGEAELVLEGDPDPGRAYIVRLLKQGYTFEAPTQQVAVREPLVAPATNIFDFEATVPTLPESLNPDYCRITGRLVDVGGRPVSRDVKIRVQPVLIQPEGSPGGIPYPADPSILSGDIIASGSIFASVNGQFDFELPRGGCFQVHVYGLETPDLIVNPIFVPDAAAAQLEDILLPYVVSVVYESDPISVGVAGSVEVGVTVTSSDGRSITRIEEIQRLIEFTSGDEEVMTVELTGNGILTVGGASVGSTTIGAARKDNTTAPQRPAVPALVVTPPVVNVT